MKYGLIFINTLELNADAPNTTNCFRRGLNFWFQELNLIKYRYMYGSFEDNVYNTTKLMKNISNTLWVCTDMLENLMIVKGKEYEQFEDFSTFIASFF